MGQINGSKKRITLQCEKKSKLNARRSIVTKVSIKKGSILNKTNLIMKRPGTGISPEKIYKIIGRKAVKDLNEDVILKKLTSNNMQIDFVIMCGGYGARLKPFTYLIPKPFLTANNISPFEYTLKNILGNTNARRIL